MYIQVDLKLSDENKEPDRKAEKPVLPLKKRARRDRRASANSWVGRKLRSTRLTGVAMAVRLAGLQTYQ